MVVKQSRNGLEMVQKWSGNGLKNGIKTVQKWSRNGLEMVQKWSGNGRNRRKKYIKKIDSKKT